MDNHKWQDLNEVHPELGDLMAEANKTATEDMAAGFINDLLNVEQAMYTDFGNPEGDASAWVITLGEQGEYDEETGNTSGSLMFEPVVKSGDVYEVLNDKRLFSRLLLSNAVGMIVRVGGRASVKDDDADFVQQDVIVTIMVNGSGLFTAVRLLGEDRVETEWVGADTIVDNVADVNAESITGKGRLADVAVSSFMTPTTMRDNRPDMAKAFLEMLEGDK